MSNWQSFTALPWPIVQSLKSAPFELSKPALILPFIGNPNSLDQYSYGLGGAEI